MNISFLLIIIYLHMFKPSTGLGFFLIPYFPYSFLTCSFQTLF